MIGRKREIEQLERLYNSKKAELVAICGRRRVGKTYLISQIFDDRMLFHHSGLAPEESDSGNQLKKQLNHFYSSLIYYGMKKDEVPTNWFEAFQLLRQFIKNNDHGQRMIIFFDELPWMATKGSDFIQAFEGFWNTFGSSKDNLMIIVCGSATSWMENNFINNHGGLYGRVTYEIKLKPFSLSEIKEYLKMRNIDLSSYDIAQAYMIFGGIPYYLGYLEEGKSLSQNIDDLFFKKDGILILEFDRLFKSVFTYSEKAKEIVKFLFTKREGFTRREISEKLKISDGGTLSKYLNGLVSSDFVEKYQPFTFSKREEHYKLVDPFCLFYLYFIEDSENIENFWSSNIDSPKINSWRGLAFENVCFNHIDQIKFALGISGVSTKVSAYFNKEEGYQIDLIIERMDNIINVCEIKFYSEEFVVNKEYFLKINHRSNLLYEKINKKYSIMNTLISTYGVKRNEYSSVFVKQITLEDLFKF